MATFTRVLSTLYAIFLLLISIVSAQDYGHLEQRYVNMRERLSRDYVRIGYNEYGYSIPMEKRVLNNESGMNCKDNAAVNETAAIWDDNGLMAMGKYIAILCAEYELKRLSNERCFARMDSYRTLLIRFDTLD